MNGAPRTDHLTPAGSPAVEKDKVPEEPMAEADGLTLSEMAFAVPETLTTRGEPETLSVSVMVSESGPEAVPAGAKVIEIVQVPMEGIDPGQPFTLVKSLGLAPPKMTEEILRAPVPELVTVTAVALLVDP